MPTMFDSHEEFTEWFSKDIESHAEKQSGIDESKCFLGLIADSVVFNIVDCVDLCRINFELLLLNLGSSMKL